LAAGFLEHDAEMFKLTDMGKAAGLELCVSKQYELFSLWPAELKL